MKECQIRKLKTDQQNGKAKLHNCRVEELDTKLQQSKLRINSDVAVIKASLQNQSELSVKNISEIILKKDSNSSFSVY